MVDPNFILNVRFFRTDGVGFIHTFYTLINLAFFNYIGVGTRRSTHIYVACEHRPRFAPYWGATATLYHIYIS
jgi:hypothetical protein